MTVHQLHYTSCEDGLEGIQGFQISAVTPGAPQPLVELAVRSSAYEVGPNLAGQLGAGDLGAFPIAFGYVRSGPSATLFQSRYVGADHTGRMGNYFAHALLLDDAERELAGVLPIDLWRSPAWVHTRQNGKSLPELPALTPGTATEPEDIRRFLAGPDRPARLAELIGAVQRVLVAGRGRLVLVAEDDQTAALWLAALCRSLPRALGLRVSFVTYTARPEDSDILVCCTTPGVRLPSYGDFSTVDTTGTAGDAESTRYGRALARLWAENGAGAAISLAERASPALAAADLDAFAVLLEFFSDRAGAAPLDEAPLLDAVCLAAERIPGGLSADAWQRIADHVQDCGGPADLARWADVLRAAVHRREPVPASLLGTYFIATLKVPQRLWLPVLRADELEDVAEHAVLPALANERTTTILDRLGEQRDLVDALVRVLDRRLTDQAELRRLAVTLNPAAVQLVQRTAGQGSRVALLADLVLARAGKADPVAVLGRAAGNPGLDWWQLESVLWPEDPPTDEAVRALRTLPAEVLRRTGLVSRIAQRLLGQVERDQVGPNEDRLIETLLGSPLSGELRPAELTALTAARLIVHFRLSAPKRNAEREVRNGLRLLPDLPPALGDRLERSLAAFILRTSGPAVHRALLSTVLDAETGSFLAAYHEGARAELSKSRPNQVAQLVVIWRTLPEGRTRRRLIEKALPEALSRRRRKHLDKIGELLEPTAAKLGLRAAQAPKGGWPKWWRTWREAYERRGFLALIGLGRRG